MRLLLILGLLALVVMIVRDPIASMKVREVVDHISAPKATATTAPTELAGTESNEASPWTGIPMEVPPRHPTNVHPRRSTLAPSFALTVSSARSTATCGSSTC